MYHTATRKGSSGRQPAGLDAAPSTNLHLRQTSDAATIASQVEGISEHVRSAMRTAWMKAERNEPGRTKLFLRPSQTSADHAIPMPSRVQKSANFPRRAQVLVNAQSRFIRSCQATLYVEEHVFTPPSGLLSAFRSAALLFGNRIPVLLPDKRQSPSEDARRSCPRR